MGELIKLFFCSLSFINGFHLLCLQFSLVVFVHSNRLDAIEHVSQSPVLRLFERICQNHCLKVWLGLPFLRIYSVDLLYDIFAFHKDVFG